MAGSQDDRIMGLLKEYILRQSDLQDIAGKLASDCLTVSTLLELSETELEELVADYFPKGSSRGARLGFISAIRNRKKLTDEGAPVAKKPKLAAATVPGSTKKIYYGTLLEPPSELPLTPGALQEFLRQTPVRLPMRDELMFRLVDADELLTLEVPEGAETLASVVDSHLLEIYDSEIWNEATGSSYLFDLTGKFISRLNAEAPRSRRLINLGYALDSPNPHSTQTAADPLAKLSRPDFQLFVKCCLILRWENKFNYESFDLAVHENVTKLKVWSTLFYDALPYVIGGSCAGKQFRWLILVPNGEEVDFEFISPIYDLRSLKDVAAFLQSNVRMHCLLQKLQEKLTDSVKVRLYRPMLRVGGGTITIFPDAVKKEIPNDDEASYAVRKAIYNSITGSKYLIQGTVKNSKKKTVLVLKPVGDPHSKPVNLTELKDAIHDILCGLEDLHKVGYTHRDIRWENCIKVNVRGLWKWILIDLENAGLDAAEWSVPNLKGWDDSILESKGKKKIYTKASDVYLLGKLICEWIDEVSVMDKTGYDVIKLLGGKMMRQRLPAAEVKKDFCKKSCNRCRTFGES